jgi:hypothetical protein
MNNKHIFSKTMLDIFCKILEKSELIMTTENPSLGDYKSQKSNECDTEDCWNEAITISAYGQKYCIVCAPDDLNE